MAHSNDRSANRLANETSPYLLQHAHNPVEWYPWGPEALERARTEDRPIFLSVGYSACHWCHVMERESFEDDAIAQLMNAHFVNVKVDREERPDIDQIYMAAVQAMTGHGGWPMSVFLTPELKPFYGGTYFPPKDVRGMSSFPRILQELHRAWMERRADVERVANGMAEQLEGLGRVADGTGEVDTRLLDSAARALARSFEPRYGGFGSAPKFPHPMDLKVLLRQHARVGDAQSLHIVRHTLDHMARGGIYDHLGGGFARYSTDDRWLVPHFEKMLYDNALLASVYVEAFQVSREAEYARVAREIFDYVLGRMTSPEGGFYSTEDADSEGEEGKFYVWTLQEIQEILGPERARTFAYVYDVTATGNWEGKCILNLPKPLEQAASLLGRDDIDNLRAELAEDRARLLEVRERRVPPGKDTKILASWNGLMIAALAEGGRALKQPHYLEAAGRAAGFVLERMRQSDGRLWHSYREGKVNVNGLLEDYACMIDGLVRLYESTGTLAWLDAALDLAGVLVDRFLDRAGKGFFETGHDHETLLVRPKSLLDNATPSANAMAATGLLRLGALTGRAEIADAGRAALQAAESLIRQYPTAAGQSLIALDFDLAPPREVAVVAGADQEEFRAVLEALREPFDPNTVIAPSPGGTAPPALGERVPLLADRPARRNRTTTYICRNFTCDEPVTSVDELRTLLDRGDNP